MVEFGNNESQLWEKTLPDGSFLIGEKGSGMHTHICDDFIKIKEGETIIINYIWKLIAQFLFSLRECVLIEFIFFPVFFKIGKKIIRVKIIKSAADFL